MCMVQVGDDEPKETPAGGGIFKKLSTVLIVAFLAGAMLWPFLNWQSTLVVGLIILAGVGIIQITAPRPKPHHSHFRLTILTSS